MFYASLNHQVLLVIMDNLYLQTSSYFFILFFTIAMFNNAYNYNLHIAQSHRYVRHRFYVRPSQSLMMISLIIHF